MKQKEQVIARFDHLAVTELRKHFSDDELNLVFRVLNRDLLEMPLGKNGAVISRREEIIATLRGLLGRMRDGIYGDAAISFPLPKGGEPLAGPRELGYRSRATGRISNHAQALERISSPLSNNAKLLRTSSSHGVRRLKARPETTARFLLRERSEDCFASRNIIRKKADEPRQRAELKKIEDSITAANERIAKLGAQLDDAKKAQAGEENAIRRREDDFNKVMGNFNLMYLPGIRG